MSCKKCADNKCLPKLPARICPVPPDDPITPIVGGLFVLVLGAVGLTAVLSGVIVLENYFRYGQWHKPGHYAPPENVTPEKESN